MTRKMVHCEWRRYNARNWWPIARLLFVRLLYLQYLYPFSRWSSKHAICNTISAHAIYASTYSRNIVPSTAQCCCNCVNAVPLKWYDIFNVVGRMSRDGLKRRLTKIVLMRLCMTLLYEIWRIFVNLTIDRNSASVVCFGSRAICHDTQSHNQ